MESLPLHTLTVNNVINNAPGSHKAMVTLSIGPLEKVVFGYGRTSDKAIANAKTEARTVARQLGSLENARREYRAEWDRLA